MIEVGCRKRMDKRVFCVIRYYVTMINTNERCANYEVVFNPKNNFKCGNFLVSTTDAYDIIREYGLVLAHNDENGSVWDTPDQKFLNKFEGYFSFRTKPKDDG